MRIFINSHRETSTAFKVFVFAVENQKITTTHSTYKVNCLHQAAIVVLSFHSPWNVFVISRNEWSEVYVSDVRDKLAAVQVAETLFLFSFSSIV